MNKQELKLIYHVDKSGNFSTWEVWTSSFKDNPKRCLLQAFNHKGGLKIVDVLDNGAPGFYSVKGEALTAAIGILDKKKRELKLMLTETIRETEKGLKEKDGWKCLNCGKANPYESGFSDMFCECGKSFEENKAARIRLDNEKQKSS